MILLTSLQLDEVIALYLQAVEQGEPTNPQLWLYRVTHNSQQSLPSFSQPVTGSTSWSTHQGLAQQNQAAYSPRNVGLRPNNRAART